MTGGTLSYTVKYRWTGLLKDGAIFLEDGTPLKEGKYRTTDLSKSEQGFYVTANGLKSDVFKVSIREPFAEDAYETITYPVVFHLIQDKTKVELGQGLERIL